MTMVITEFTKGNGLKFEVSTNAQGGLFVTLGETTARATISTPQGIHCYKLVDEKFIANFERATGLDTKGTLNLSDPSAETAEEKAKEIAKEAELHANNAYYKNLSDDTKITFQVHYHSGAYVVADTRVSSEIAELNELMANNDNAINSVFGKFGEVVSGWEGTKYVATKSQIATIIAAFKKIEAGEELEKEKMQLEADEHFAATLAIAKETGEKQELSRKVVDCDNSADYCSQDALYTMLDKDGKITYERIHLH